MITVYLKNQQTLDFHWLKKYSINDIDLELGLMMNINNDIAPNNLKTTVNVIFSFFSKSVTNNQSTYYNF